jgi:hypothetical protein
LGKATVLLQLKVKRMCAAVDGTADFDPKATSSARPEIALSPVRRHVLDHKPDRNHDLTELFVARQQLIERFELAQCIRLNWATHMFLDKRFEPIPQRARLRRNGVEFSGKSALPKGVQHVVGHQPSLLAPREKVFP